MLFCGEELGKRPSSILLVETRFASRFLVEGWGVRNLRLFNNGLLEKVAAVSSEGGFVEGHYLLLCVGAKGGGVLMKLGARMEWSCGKNIRNRWGIFLDIADLRSVWVQECAFGMVLGVEKGLSGSHSLHYRTAHDKDTSMAETTDNSSSSLQ